MSTFDLNPGKMSGMIEAKKAEILAATVKELRELTDRFENGTDKLDAVHMERAASGFCSVKIDYYPGHGSDGPTRVPAWCRGCGREIPACRCPNGPSGPGQQDLSPRT